MGLLARIQPKTPCDELKPDCAPLVQCIECGYLWKDHKQKSSIFRDGKFIRFETNINEN